MTAASFQWFISVVLPAHLTARLRNTSGPGVDRMSASFAPPNTDTLILANFPSGITDPSRSTTSATSSLDFVDRDAEHSWTMASKSVARLSEMPAVSATVRGGTG